MAKTSSQFVCSECGWSGPKWLGRCPECGQWGTIEEFHEARPSASSRTAAPGRTSRTLSHAVPDSAAKPITEISTENISRIDTGFTEFNRVLGGGFRPHRFRRKGEVLLTWILHIEKPDNRINQAPNPHHRAKGQGVERHPMTMGSHIFPAALCGKTTDIRQRFHQHTHR